MTNSITFHNAESCISCYYEKVEKLKAASSTCTTCNLTSTKDDPYPNFKPISEEN